MSNDERAHLTSIGAAASALARCNNDVKNAGALMRDARLMHSLESWEVKDAERQFHAAVVKRDDAKAELDSLTGEMPEPNDRLMDAVFPARDDLTQELAEPTPLNPIIRDDSLRQYTPDGVPPPDFVT